PRFRPDRCRPVLRLAACAGFARLPVARGGGARAIAPGVPVPRALRAGRPSPALARPKRQSGRFSLPGKRRRGLLPDAEKGSRPRWTRVGDWSVAATNRPASCCQERPGTRRWSSSFVVVHMKRGGKGSLSLKILDQMGNALCLAQGGVLIQVI